MTKIGFVGFGSMGGVLIRSLLDADALSEEQVVVTTRTREKLNDFVNRYPRVEIAPTVAELGARCGRVFVCTGTMEAKGVIAELARCLPANAHVVTTTGNIEIKAVESVFSGKVTKIMPTQLCEIGEGVTLVCHNAKVLPQDREFIDSMLGAIGTVKNIDESRFGLADDLTSCAPAFFASILRNLAEVARQHGSLTDAELTEMVFGRATVLPGS